MTTILLVDDDKFLLDMYAKKFTSSGFEVNTAESGTDAIDKIKEGLIPDVVVADVTMPGIDGFEFLEQIKEERLLPDAVTILLTNQSMESDVARAKEIGVHEYIVKATMIPSEVVDAVQKAVNNLKPHDN